MEEEPGEESQESHTLSDTESLDESNISVIQVHFGDFDGSEEQHMHAGENSRAVKGKYYKQTYRQAWESMPDFEGWLRGVVGQPTRAYCMYCQKTLHAHRLSLLKHTCTIRHQKAAQQQKNRKGKNVAKYSGNNLPVSPHLNKMDKEHTLTEVLLEEDASDNQQDSDIAGLNDSEDVEYTEQEELDPEDGEEETHHIEFEHVNTDTAKIEKRIKFLSIQIRCSSNLFVTKQPSNPMDKLKPPISTHVLNTAKGMPVQGLQISLYKLIEGRWTYINEGVTSNDGRVSEFIDRGDFTTGRYKLHYDVDRYFEVSKQSSLYPFIEIVFDCRSTNDHYHIPLLLSPYGYTTYRGT